MKKTYEPPKPAVRSSKLVCDAPPLTPDANGWWWRWWNDAMCPCIVTYLEDGGYGDPALKCVMLNRHGGTWNWLMRPRAKKGRWGGRLAVNGASHTDGTLRQNPAPETP